MITYGRSWWWVKERKQMVLVLMIVTLMLQFHMKGCVGCLDAERIGLLQLKSYLMNVYNVEEENFLESWSHDDADNSDCCKWERVNCSDAIGGHIVALSLEELKNSYISYDRLKLYISYGQYKPFEQLPPRSPPPRSLNLSLFHSFPQLQNLDFSSNEFSDLFDPIHGYKSFQRLEKLRILDLSFNAFNNSVLPFVSAATSVRTLNLRDNFLTGVFPPNVLKDMPKLQELDLSHNDFTDLDSLGNSEFCRLMNLRELDLSYNALTSMPDCMGNLTRLRTLELRENQLNGNLSSFVSSLPSALEYLSLLDNNFNSSFLFKSLVNHTRLKVFKLSSIVGVIQAHAENSWVPLFQLKMLVLRNVSLGGTIPAFLLHQHDLRFIDLSHNKLTGAFPSWLVRNNTRLHVFLMNSNSLTEFQLPRLVHGLISLGISSNKINDSIPEDIGIVFPRMRYMYFASNHFHGTIPSSMGEMTSLQDLDMSSNGLYGQLPKPVLSNCYSLKLLKLSNNQLEGNIFPKHANLTNLLWLFLDGNSFSGSLTKGLLNSTNLRFLDISDNSISGRLPIWIARLSSLSNLHMRGNQLEGPFPSQLQNLYYLSVLDISHNSFSGSIPRNFDFPLLTELRLQSNDFMGSIPDTLFNCEQLELLDLRNNNFSGKIMNTIGKESNLRVLLLRNNSLQGHIPEKIGRVLSNVGLLDLSHNIFEGAIPPSLANMSFGAYVDSHTFNRKFHTAFLLPEDMNWKYTSALDLDEDVKNDKDVEYLRDSSSTSSTYGWALLNIVDFFTKNRYEAYQGDYMYGLDLSSNQLSGEIPVEIGELKNIKSLNFSSNRLTGSIPDSFSKLEDLESLDLSNNKLNGSISPQLANLNSLGYFNVSFNNLSGKIPLNGHLLTFDEKSYIGNAHLCGPPTNTSCNPTSVPQPSAEEEEEEEGDGVIDMVWFYWSCGAVYITTFLAMFAFLCIDSRWSEEWFYRVDLFIHHLQIFKRRFMCN